MNKISDTTRFKDIETEREPFYPEDQRFIATTGFIELWEDDTHYARVTSEYDSPMFNCQIFEINGHKFVDVFFTERYFVLKNYLEMYKRGVK
jgi:hypothetical protein